MIGLSELAVVSGEKLSDLDQTRLIAAYQFVFNGKRGADTLVQ